MPVAPLNAQHHNLQVTGELSLAGDLSMTGDLTVPGDLTLGGDIVGLEPQDYVPVFVAGANVVTVPVAVSAQYSRVGSEVRVNIVLGQT